MKTLVHILLLVILYENCWCGEHNYKKHTSCRCFSTIFSFAIFSYGFLFVSSIFFSVLVFIDFHIRFHTIRC
uniref:Uncharacterized protein n=1 Tax=Ascaris lumbricoides TaxID=6252 RepID=A0A0M3HKS6_ASCLU